MSTLTVVLTVLCALGATPFVAASTAGAAQASGTPIVIGNVASYTSEQAPSEATAVGQDAIKAWASWVNAHGGINGHPVKLIVKDDKGDQALAVSDVKELVEQDHVVAFVSNQDGSLVSGYTEYLNQQKIPVLGGNLYTPTWDSDPMFYGQGSGVIAGLTAGLSTAKKYGYKKFGSLACSEAAQCAQGNDALKALSKGAGVNYVYGGVVSSTASDYTASCLAAKSSGATILELLIPTADEGLKIADDCARQNYKPAWIVPGEALGAGYLKSSNFNNTFNTTGVQPWFSTDASMNDFHAAMKKANVDVNGAVEPVLAVDAWTSGVMLQKAVEMSGVTGTPTSADILAGLQKFNNETFGNLSGGVTFTDPTKKVANCFFVIQIKKQKFTLPQGVKTSCNA